MKSMFPAQTIASVASFIELIAQWYVGEDDVLFRGHRVEGWSLMPRLGRIKPRARFSGSITKLEAKILGDFERLAVPHIGGRTINSRWDLIALAQHHGLPTRLLDWSSNPLVALWFAVERPAESGSNAVVWAYRSKDEDHISHEPDPDQITRTKIFRPHHHDSRIVAQAGWFSVHKFSESTKRFNSLDRITNHKPRLRKFVIPANKFPAIRDDLGRCGINRASLFPDLGGLCGYLNWKYEQLDDESEYDMNTVL